MGNFRVVVTDDRFGSYEEEKSVLSEIGCTVEVCDLNGRDEGLRALSNADGVLVNTFAMTADVIHGLSQCKVISRYGVGVDNVDVPAASSAGIWVARVPDYGYEEVSDHALALLFACIRNIVYVDKRIREGGWNLKDEYRSFRVAGRTLGIVGFGLIGRTLFRKVRGLGLAKIFVYDPFVSDEAVREAGAEPSALATLLAESDYVSVHVPLSNESRGMIDKKHIALMKPTAILVNTSRGGVVSEAALADALAKGDLCAAGLDVFEREPLPANSPLLHLDNVILTDHTAYYSEEAIVELKTKAAQNILEVLQGRKPLYPVNEPASRE